jgi:hypothetical protein
LRQGQHETFSQLLKGVCANQPEVTDSHGHVSPSLTLLVEEQLKRLKNPKHAWHPLVLKWALTVFDKGGPAAYNALGKSGFLDMPSESTIKRLTRGSTQRSGIVPEHILRMEQSASDYKLSGFEREMILSLDELHCQAGLSWKRHTIDGEVINELVGFGDELDGKLSDLAPGLTELSSLSNKILQYFVRSVGGGWSMPVAYYPFRKSSHLRLNDTFWEVVTALNRIDLRVHMVGPDPLPDPVTP